MWATIFKNYREYTFIIKFKFNLILIMSYYNYIILIYIEWRARVRKC